MRLSQTFLVMWHLWCWCQNLKMSLSMTHDANGIINVTTAFCRSRWLKWGATWLLWSVMTLASHDTNGTTAFLRSRWSKWGWLDILGHVILMTLASALHDANGIVNSTIPFFRSKWNASYFYVMWHNWHQH